MRALTLILLIACSIIGFLGGYDYASKHCYNVCTVTDTIVERDTITLVPDTAYREVSLGEKVVKVVVRDTLCRTDTVEVSLQFVQREYRDSDYNVWVSGYEPRLDSISVFPRTVTVHERIMKKEKARRWGVYGGVGIGASERRFAPYVGVGIGYRIF